MVNSNQIRILVFPAGTEIGLEIYHALRYEKNLELFAASSAPSHADYIYEKVYNDIPYVNHPDFNNKLRAVIERERIDFVFPAHDDAIIALKKFEDDLGAKVLASSFETCQIARSKELSYQALSKFDFVPRRYNSEKEVKHWPVFAKPNKGQGSFGIATISNAEEFQLHQQQHEDYVYCEYLPGIEVTVDCFSDRNGELKYVKPRIRMRTRNGIAVRSETLNSPNDIAKIEEIARKINSTIAFEGVWFFQLKQDGDSNWKLLELAPRVSGTMGLNRALGINLPLMTIFDRLGYEIQVIDNLHLTASVDRYFGSRYLTELSYDHVYIDFDDTVTFKGNLNPISIAYLAHLRARNIGTTLITRHQGNIVQSLERLGLTSLFFDEIIHITDGAPKSNYISHENSIFIDDSFRERADVSSRLSIPCFSVDAIETLINWKLQ